MNYATIWSLPKLSQQISEINWRPDVHCRSFVKWLMFHVFHISTMSYHDQFSSDVTFAILECIFLFKVELKTSHRAI